MPAPGPPDPAVDPLPGGDRPIVIVPCFNEAGRLDASEMCRLSDAADVWLVDDGSHDGTLDSIRRIAASTPSRVRALTHAPNLGKAETVRTSMLAACGEGAPFVGFFDADLATPVDEMLTLLTTIRGSEAEAVTAARVALSGRDIRRTAARHYTGRVFSTIASLAIGSVYYDTQCGAKIFRNSASLRAALAEPFLSRWAFDVELLGRMLAGAPGIPAVAAEQLVEHPLQAWHDVAGSKLTALEAWNSAMQLLRIWRDLRRRRKAAEETSE